MEIGVFSPNSHPLQNLIYILFPIQTQKSPYSSRRRSPDNFIMDSNPVAVINSLFCVPCPVDLAFTTKPPGHKKSGGLAAVDTAGNILFRAPNPSRVGFTQLHDAAGHVILTMKAKFRTMHDRWQAFAGDSAEAKDLVFSIKRSSTLQFHDEWLVYLAANTEEEECDFKINGSYSKKNYTIYRGDSSSSIVAQFSKEHRLNISLNKHAFGVAIAPNYDYSFVTALISIFHMVYDFAAIITGAAIIGSTVGIANSS